LGAGLSSVAHAQAVCGDGVLEGAESCDDGNLSSNDCCSATCEPIACSPAPPIGIAWEELGPRNVGGRVTALAVDPQDPNHLVLGTPSAGVWKSTNGGLSWVGLAPYLGLIRLSAVAIDPSNPDRIVFGTGEVTDGGTQRKGVGLVRSEDGGATYLMSDLPTNPYVAQVMIWEDEPSRVLIATDLGIWISHDGGVAVTESLRGESISALQRDPFDANAVYAAGRSGLFRSDDRGESFTALARWPLGDQVGPGAGMATLAVSGQVDGRLYATLQVLAAFDKTADLLFLRSEDGGQTLETLASPPPICPTTDSCGYAHALAIDPDDDARLLAGGDHLYASDDGGQSWRSVSGTIHGVHEIALYPGGGFVAAKSGIAHLDANWTNLETRNTGLAITGVEALDVSDGPDGRILIGTADAGTVLSGPGGTGFESVFGDAAPSGPVAFDPFDPDTIYASEAGGLLFRSNDLGMSFTEITTGIDTGQQALDVPPLAANPLIPGSLYTGRMQIFSTNDQGDLWSPFRPPGFPEIAHLWPSPVDDNRLYFGLKTGGTLYKADDTHTHILQILPEASSLVLNSIFLDPAAENVLFAALTDTASQRGLVFKSYDFGQDWTDITPRNLPPAHAIVRDRFGAIYVGTAQGIFRSANDGFTWTPFQRGLSAFGIRFLKIVNDQLYAGTVGRGLFRTPLQELFSIDTIPPGLPLLIDGELVSSPYFATWQPGSLHAVEPYLIQTTDRRQRFASWSDGGDLLHDYTAPDGVGWLTAAIIESYRLQTQVRDGLGGRLLALPASPDGFYDSGTFVSVLAVPDPTYRLASLTGQLSGVQGGLGLALMDRPRAVEARFEPLEVEILSKPSGLQLELDGNPIVAPATFSWEASSQHQVWAPERVTLDPSDPVELVFDGWTDLRGRTHVYTMYRDSFITDLSAIFLRTTPNVALSAGQSQRLRSPGQADALRRASLRIEGEPGSPAISGLVFLRGGFHGTLNIEVPLTPSTPATQHHRFVRGGALDGETQLIVHNPGATDASISLLLRDPNGAGLVARLAALTVPATGSAHASLRELIALPPHYEGLLTVISDVPVAASIQTSTENLRPNTMLDPMLYVPFGPGDPGVPSEPNLQALICGPDTQHEVVLINTGSTPLSGMLDLVDEDGAPISGIPEQGGSASLAYAVPPGGHLVVPLDIPSSTSGAGSVCSAQLRIEPDAPQPTPFSQLLERQQAGATLGIPILLPRTLPPSASLDQFVVPVDRQLRDSGIVATNLSGSARSLSLSLIGEAGSVQGTAVVPISPGSQRVLLASEIFPTSPTDFRGRIEGSSDGELAIVGLLVNENDRAEQLVSGFPVLTRATSAAPYAPLVFPHFPDGDTWSSELYLFNPSATDANLSLRYLGRDGTETPFPIEAP
jgi:cysteine-rich repeat protein